MWLHWPPEGRKFLIGLDLKSGTLRIGKFHIHNGLDYGGTVTGILWNDVNAIVGRLLILAGAYLFTISKTLLFRSVRNFLCLKSSLALPSLCERNA